MQYIVVYPDSHNSIGLFSDLKDCANVQLCVGRAKKVKSLPLRFLKKMHWKPSINRIIDLPFKRKWYYPIELKVDDNEEYCVVIVDAAMRNVQVEQLKRLSRKENVRCVLVLLNSMDANSPGIQECKRDFKKVDWDDVYTFDPRDAEKYDYKYLGCCYYSKHDEDRVRNAHKDTEPSDIYFVGGLKGGREEEIISVYEKLTGAGIKAYFELLVTGKRRLERKPHENSIHYYAGGWIPYEKTLAKALNTKVILEVLQAGQNGPSVRYYEAVCHNKKLLTNNPGIKNLPYYDERYMRVYRSVEDIDVSWIMEDVTVDYGYQGDFSPISLLDRVLH